MNSILSHENKKALSSFYHKKYFWLKINIRCHIGVLHSFSTKKNFYDKIELRLFYFHVTNVGKAILSHQINLYFQGSEKDLQCFNHFLTQFINFSTKAIFLLVVPHVKPGLFNFFWQITKVLSLL